MDPVSAFSIAAGAVSVVDIALRSVKTFHELSRDGSVAEFDRLEELARQLCALLTSSRTPD